MVKISRVVQLVFFFFGPIVHKILDICSPNWCFIYFLVIATESSNNNQTNKSNQWHNSQSCFRLPLFLRDLFPEAVTFLLEKNRR